MRALSLDCLFELKTALKCFACRADLTKDLAGASIGIEDQESTEAEEGKREELKSKRPEVWPHLARRSASSLYLSLE